MRLGMSLALNGRRGSGVNAGLAFLSQDIGQWWEISDATSEADQTIADKFDAAVLQRGATTGVTTTDPALYLAGETLAEGARGYLDFDGTSDYCQFTTGINAALTASDALTVIWHGQAADATISGHQRLFINFGGSGAAPGISLGFQSGGTLLAAGRHASGFTAAATTTCTKQADVVCAAVFESDGTFFAWSSTGGAGTAQTRAVDLSSVTAPRSGAAAHYGGEYFHGRTYNLRIMPGIAATPEQLAAVAGYWS